jgi:hypothetical protein
VPGIVSVIGERLRSHANAICAGDAPWRSAISENCRLPTPRSGKNGTNTIPSAAQ